MPSVNYTLADLREAAALSPDNAPLRRLLADVLLAAGRPDDAEREYRNGLAQAPDDARLKLGLAHAFHQQGKHTQAVVVIEDLLKRQDAPAASLVLHARLLLQDGEARRAKHQYRAALDADPALADADLAQQLGLSLDAGHRRAASGLTARTVKREPPPDAAARRLLPVKRPGQNFADVVGLEAVKDELRLRLLEPCKHRDLYAAYGKVDNGGILLFGPPGCGKTLLARAAAGAAQAGLLTVGFDEALDLWLGRAGRDLASIFAAARAAAPSVLFFDDFDALFARRSASRSAGKSKLQNQWLSELDAPESANRGVTLLAATSALWRLDAGLLLPGRFARILFVPPPDLDDRAALLRVLCCNKPVEAIDFARLARRTDGFSGADLQTVVKRAVEGKLREAVHDGQPRPLRTRDLLAAVETVRPSTRDWFATARNYALYANHGGLYEDVLKYLKLS
jgi:ATP-dependent 26S proteasome regulatory subunit